MIPTKLYECPNQGNRIMSAYKKEKAVELK